MSKQRDPLICCFLRRLRVSWPNSHTKSSSARERADLTLLSQGLTWCRFNGNCSSPSVSGTPFSNTTQRGTHAVPRLGRSLIMINHIHSSLYVKWISEKKIFLNWWVGSLFGDRVHIYHAVIVMRNLGAGRGEPFLICCMSLEKSTSFLGALNLNNKWFYKWTQTEGQGQFSGPLKEKFQGKQALWERRIRKRRREVEVNYHGGWLYGGVGGFRVISTESKEAQNTKQNQQMKPTEANYKPAKQQWQQGYLSSQHRKEIKKNN